MERYPKFLKIGNQPWNIIKFANNSSHMRLAHGTSYLGRAGKGFLGRMWHGTPGWFKAGTVTGGLYFGDVIENNKR